MSHLQSSAWIGGCQQIEVPNDKQAADLKLFISSQSVSKQCLIHKAIICDGNAICTSASSVLQPSPVCREQWCMFLDLQRRCHRLWPQLSKKSQHSNIKNQALDANLCRDWSKQSGTMWRHGLEHHHIFSAVMALSEWPIQRLLSNQAMGLS